MTTDDGNDQPYRGKELHGSAATVSSGFRPSFFRYVYYDSNLRFAAASALVLTVVAVALGLGGYALIVQGGWVAFVLGILLAGLGALIGLIGLIFGVLVFALFLKNGDVFENALLSPGIVHSRDPLVVMVLASMGNGSDADYYGISRTDLARLPCHSHEPGTRVPCVCGFASGDEPDRWAAFETDFIAYGTGSAARVEECLARLGDEPFKRLERYLKTGKLPQNANEIILLDGEMTYLETIDKKAAMAGAQSAPEPETTDEA
jgi:hypothetical protein